MLLGYLIYYSWYACRFQLIKFMGFCKLNALIGWSLSLCRVSAGKANHGEEEDD